MLNSLSFRTSECALRLMLDNNLEERFSFLSASGRVRRLLLSAEAAQSLCFCSSPRLSINSFFMGT